MSSNKIKFVYYDRAYLNHKDEFDSEIQRVLSSGNLILREDVEKFEENLARFVGTKYAIALNSGTDALVLALKALNIRGRVAVPFHTFKSTCGAILTAGAIPVVYDMNEDWRYNDSCFIIEKCVAQISVHIAGELSEILDAGIPVIEDACQALGAIKNPTTGAQCWSFYPAKILGAFGDAGAVTTNDEKIAEYIREARNHFKGDNRDFGMNSRMDNLQAAILNVKFKYLPEYIKRRQEVADMYYTGLQELEENGKIKLPNRQIGRVYQDFIILVTGKSSVCVCDHWSPISREDCTCTKREGLYLFLKQNGVEVLRNEYPWSPDYPKLPLAAKYEAETLRLPCNAEITDEEVDCVIQKIKEFYDV